MIDVHLIVIQYLNNQHINNVSIVMFRIDQIESNLKFVGNYDLQWTVKYFTKIIDQEKKEAQHMVSWCKGQESNPERGISYKIEMFSRINYYGKRQNIFNKYQAYACL